MIARLRLAPVLLAAAGIILAEPQPKSLKAGYGNAAPISYVDSSGQPRGFAVDVLNEAARREGVRIQWVLGSAKPANDLLREGAIDLLAAGVITPERQLLFYVSDPWWGSDLVGLVPDSGPIRREPDLAGRRLAIPASGALLAGRYHPAAIVGAASARDAVAEVCSGRADAAIMEGIFLRELLVGMPVPCRDTSLRTVDLSQQRDYVLVARREVADAARKLRARIDEITLDGTLSQLAFKNPPVSTPYATRLTELVRVRYERRILDFGLTAVAALLVLVAGFVFWLQRSRRRLRAANAELRKLVEDRKQAETALRTSEQRFRTLVETTFDWIWEVDAEGRYTYASPKVRDLLGYSPEEVVGRTPFDFMPPAEAARCRAIFFEFSAAKRPFVALENANLHKNGTQVILETSSVPVLGPKGELLGYRGMDRDITERKRLEQWRTAQAAVSRALSGGTALSETMAGVVEALGNISPWQFGMVLHADESNSGLRCLGVWQAASFQNRTLAAASCDLILAEGDCMVDAVLSSGRPQSTRLRGCAENCCLARLAREVDLAWTLGIPLHSGNRTNGVIVAFGREGCDLDERLMEMLTTVGNQVGEFVERERAQAEVRRFVSSSPVVLYALKVEPDGLRPTFVSENLERLTGHRPQEALSVAWWLRHIHPEDRDRVLAANRAPYEIEHQILEFRFRHKDGSYVWLCDEKRLLRDDQGRPSEVIGSWSDVNRRVQLEQQLLQAQKLEAIGALAGGVAHDFNNLLTVINGYSSMSLQMLSPGHPAHGQIEEILRAGELGAGLTRQLLAFSRQQELRPRVITLRSVVADTQKMLRRLIGEDIELTIRNQGTGKVKADPGQLEQVLMNLVVNARDAMPRGGTLTVATADREISQGTPGVPAGSYAELTVTDTGTGMDAALQSRIFEPFFTTKGPGRGTGLGLSTVYGIVSQSGGFIDVESRPELGSSFRVLFPLISGQIGAEAPLSMDTEWNGTETILLVEDDDAVRRVACEALRSRGYQVLEATNAGEAILIGDSVPAGELHLLLTDVVMPRVNGVELAGHLTRSRPGLRVLFMTGYMDRQLLEGTPFVSGAACLQKPFTPADLAREVRQILDMVN